MALHGHSLFDMLQKSAFIYCMLTAKQYGNYTIKYYTVNRICGMEFGNSIKIQCYLTEKAFLHGKHVQILREPTLQLQKL